MTHKKQLGFSLIETMVALAVLFAVGGIVMSGMVQLMKTQGTIDRLPRSIPAKP